MAQSKPVKVTRIVHSQGLHKAKSERLEHIAEQADAWQGCSGLSTAPQTTPDIRDAWPCRRTKASLLQPAGPRLPWPPTLDPVVSEATAP